MHFPNRPSRYAHLFETAVLTLLATVSLFGQPHAGPLPALLLLLQTLVFVHQYPVTRCKSAALRHSSDNIGLACGVALSLSLLTVFPNEAGVYLIGVAVTTLICAWKGSVSDGTERWGVLCMVGVVLGWTDVEGWGWVRALAILVPVVQRRMIAALPRCFTVAEGAIVASGVTGVVAMGVRRVSEGVKVGGECLEGAGGIWGMTISAMVGAVLAGVVGVGDVVRRGRKGWGRLGGVVGGGVIVPTYLFAWWFGVGCEPIGWIGRYLGEGKRWWVVGGWVGIVVVVLWWGGGGGGGRSVVRKGYHLAAMGIFGIGCWEDGGLIGFGSAVAVAGLVLMEMGRVCGVECVEMGVEWVGGRLVDEKDRGLVKVTHVYLLVGCAVGVWGGWGSEAGVVTVCVLDSMAAIGGRLWGRVKWFGGGRSLEGSVCGIVAGTLVGWAWNRWVDHNGKGWGTTVWGCLVAGGVEASTGQIDNLVLPLVYAAAGGLLKSKWPS